MYIKETSYTDYDGIERTEKCMFNLTKAELTMMQMEQAGGLEKRLTRMMEMHDGPGIMRTIRDLLHRSYGEKSADGRRFVKVDPATGISLADEFEQTEAYSIIFMELCTDAKAAAEFVANVVPKDIAEGMDKAKAEGAPELTVLPGATN